VTGVTVTSSSPWLRPSGGQSSCEYVRVTWSSPSNGCVSSRGPLSGRCVTLSSVMTCCAEGVGDRLTSNGVMNTCSVNSSTCSWQGRMLYIAIYRVRSAYLRRVLIALTELNDEGVKPVASTSDAERRKVGRRISHDFRNGGFIFLREWEWE